MRNSIGARIAPRLSSRAAARTQILDLDVCLAAPGHPLCRTVEEDGLLHGTLLLSER